MLSNIIKFRVRYGETDQMSFVYHGNYAQYFEMGRTEWLRDLGITYKNMEESGIMLPVISLNINFMKPGKYDDLLTLKTTLVKKPSARIEFDYEIRNEKDELLTTANSTLVFVNMKTNRPMRIPDSILNKIEKFMA
ncbi:acyl-CoA thioesterase [Lutibacter maritimus]|jgi:acyl-CoA thioester hydrolase|uniref:Acyl-CoA thioester hydrolase n=1 Tax=Lutibacter maritimus TaxID=593133 RepID=A0A1I6SD66_9FLAO|nr:thioesterase family protein [Lutibacter maritimus]SFS74874.1 acyl-CoA thioester hydrolase [Lutibacter maritimus]